MALNIFKKENTKEKAAPQGKKHTETAVGQAVKSPKEKRAGSAWLVLRNAHITEKATDLTGNDQYIFNVFPRSNKTDIRAAVENIYGVDVVSVNIVNIHPKKRRLGKINGWRPAYKKAIVQIKNGQKLELMPR